MRERVPDGVLRAAPQTLHPAVVQVLYARGLTTPQQVADFLSGAPLEPDEPTRLPDVPRAVERIVAARQRGERVAVFTDYDADGINAAAVLVGGLHRLGIKPQVRLPHRLRDGYGLTPAIVDELADAGAQVVITADCGTTAHEAAETARRRGVDVVVTDHHTCTETLPALYAVINPKRPDCVYPFKDLCGAGVAYKLLQALADALLPEGRAAMEPLLDLVAVATVADVVPLTGENRHFVRAGLEIMRSRPRPGIRAILEAAKVDHERVTCEDLGFRVAPRLNATGRLDDPGVGLETLLSEDFERARALADRLNELNAERQALERTIRPQAEALVRPSLEAGAMGLVCGDPSWPHGVLGLVAQHIVKTAYRPALAYTVRDGLATGSGRSIRGLNLVEALGACGDGLFTRFGGHAGAAGFTLPPERIAELTERFDAAVRERITPEALERVLTVDGWLRAESVNLRLAEQIEALGPFGHGFEEPVFGLRRATLIESRPVGADGRHWKLYLRPGEGVRPVGAICWDEAALAERFRPGAVVDLAFTLRRSEFRGAWKVDLFVRDVAPV